MLRSVSESADALVAQHGTEMAQFTAEREPAYGALCARLFASLPRSDQRNRGTDYLLGLLAAQGRKSIRNIAALFGGPEVEQRLHHFVCSSTWDWTPMRRALAEYVYETTAPQAWVAAPMIIPKTGTNSIGVDRRFVPELGRVLNAQQAVGVWAAAEEFSCPVNWRLQLTAPWLEDRERREKALIPDRMGAAGLEECTAEACVETARDWRLPQRAVVLDCRAMNAATVVRRLLAADVPFVARVSGGLRLTAVDAALARWSTRPEHARTITKVARSLLRPVAWRNHEAGGAARGGMAAAIRVELERPAPRSGAGAELHLLSVAGDRHGGGEELWLTDRSPADLPALVRLTRLPGRVHRDLQEVADEVGVRDFTGRSYGGWHRHITLASAAHAVRALGETAPVPVRAA
jgi:SRSO17 transposase